MFKIIFRTFTNVASTETSQSEGDEIMTQEDDSESSQFLENNDPPSSMYQELSSNKKQKIDDKGLGDSTPETSRSNTPFTILKIKKKVEDVQGMEERSKKRLELLQKIANNEDDEVDLFFKSVALKVKKFPPHLVTKSQLTILTAICEIEKEAESFTAQANNHRFLTPNPQSFKQASSNSFPTQTNSQSSSTADTYLFPLQVNTQSPYLPENYPDQNLPNNESNESTTQHGLYPL